jgi:hypothetical protein
MEREPLSTASVMEIRPVCSDKVNQLHPGATPDIISKIIIDMPLVIKILLILPLTKK